MSRQTNRFRIVATLILCMGLTAQVGCDRLLGALSGSIINVNIPLGLNGAPGLLNPFGLTQSLFVTLFGVSPNAGDGGDGSGTPGGGVDPTTLVGGLNGGGGGAPPQ